MQMTINRDAGPRTGAVVLPQDLLRTCTKYLNVQGSRRAHEEVKPFPSNGLMFDGVPCCKGMPVALTRVCVAHAAPSSLGAL